MPAVRVQLPAAPLGVVAAGGRGSRPEQSSGRLGFVPRPAAAAPNATTYGREPDTAGRAAVLTQLPSRACGFESLPLRFCFGGETEIMPRFERGVPGSNPGRSTELILWPSGSGRLPDTEESGGSNPPRITEQRTEAGDQRTVKHGSCLLLLPGLCSLSSALRCGMWCSGSTRPCEG